MLVERERESRGQGKRGGDLAVLCMCKITRKFRKEAKTERGGYIIVYFVIGTCLEMMIHVNRIALCSKRRVLLHFNVLHSDKNI